MDQARPLPGASTLTLLEVCAGAGGQAVGLERAGFRHIALVENDPDCCRTLKLNRPTWCVIKENLCELDSTPYRGVDLFAGGLPCPPFSIAGKQLGEVDERNLLSTALLHVRTVRPRALFLENVRGLLDQRFNGFRIRLESTLRDLGFRYDWRLYRACDFGVPQLRPRLLIVALRADLWPLFAWPEPILKRPPTVGDVLKDLMAEGHWRGAKAWARAANNIAPTIVGGSKKHGGPDLGPTRARAAWKKLNVDGRGIADRPPDESFVGMPRLTVRMVARLQGFDDDWFISGRKTAAYRQVGNAFPPPVAQAVGFEIAAALLRDKRISRVRHQAFRGRRNGMR
ncbi:MAG TPA: DNA (cytosine-5-)-methyltransferase [Candidatus Elarobacter sp.]